MKRAKRHPECYPPTLAKAEGYRLADTGRWRKLDGLAGIAFVVQDPADEDAAIVYVAECTCKIHADCPASKALDWATDRFTYASLERRPPAIPPRKRTVRRVVR